MTAHKSRQPQLPIELEQVYRRILTITLGRPLTDREWHQAANSFWATDLATRTELARTAVPRIG